MIVLASVGCAAVGLDKWLWEHRNKLKSCVNSVYFNSCVRAHAHTTRCTLRQQAGPTSWRLSTQRRRTTWRQRPWMRTCGCAFAWYPTLHAHTHTATRCQCQRRHHTAPRHRCTQPAPCNVQTWPTVLLRDRDGAVAPREAMPSRLFVYITRTGACCSNKSKGGGVSHGGKHNQHHHHRAADVRSSPVLDRHS